MSAPDPALATRGDIAEALALLTRLPVAARADRGAAAAWAWPLAGVAVGLIAGSFGWAALALGLPAPLAAAIVLAALILSTGGLHEDGLADTADGLWGGHDPARRLEIMKDSRTGSYGVLALGLALILRWSALVALLDAGLLFAPILAAAVLSRAPMAMMAAALPNARGGGLSAHVGRPGQNTASLALVLAALIAFGAVGWSGFAALVWVAVAAGTVGLIARAKIGGQTGDILGATQQASEIAAFAALTASLT